MGKATAADEPTTSMTREEYQVGAEQQPAGRFERISRVVVAMAPERVGHNRRKRRTYEVLDRAVRAEGLPCEAYADGVTVEIGDSDYEPTRWCIAATD
jgi:Uma2 family endonuclease